MSRWLGIHMWWTKLCFPITHMLRSWPPVCIFGDGGPGGANGKEPACRCRRHKRYRFDPWSGRSPGGRHGNPLQYSWADKESQLVSQLLKNPPAIQNTWVRSLGWKDPLKEGMATHSSIIAWRIPMDREVWQATVHGVAKNRTWLSD